VSGGYNINQQIGYSTLPGDTITNCSPSTNLHLGPLASNGGSTQTMALLAGSCAIDAGARHIAVAWRRKHRSARCAEAHRRQSGYRRVRSAIGQYLRQRIPVEQAHQPSAREDEVLVPISGNDELHNMRLYAAYSDEVFAEVLPGGTLGSSYGKRASDADSAVVTWSAPDAPEYPSHFHTISSPGACCQPPTCLHDRRRFPDGSRADAYTCSVDCRRRSDRIDAGGRVALAKVRRRHR